MAQLREAVHSRRRSFAMEVCAGWSERCGAAAAKGVARASIGRSIYPVPPVAGEWAQSFLSLTRRSARARRATEGNRNRHQDWMERIGWGTSYVPPTLDAQFATCLGTSSLIITAFLRCLEKCRPLRRLMSICSTPMSLTYMSLTSMCHGRAWRGHPRLPLPPRQDVFPVIVKLP
jgi:hypothetical protein